MIAKTITLILSNPTVSLLVLGLIAALISIRFKKSPRSRSVIAEAFVAYFFLALSHSSVTSPFASPPSSPPPFFCGERQADTLFRSSQRIT